MKGSEQVHSWGGMGDNWDIATLAHASTKTMILDLREVVNKCTLQEKQYIIGTNTVGLWCLGP